MARRWRHEFDTASDVLEAMLRSLRLGTGLRVQLRRHPEAASGVASSALDGCKLLYEYIHRILELFY